MNSQKSLWRPLRACARGGMAVVCSVLIAGGDSSISFAQTASTATTSAPIPAEKLNSLVAPIALYPDDLLAQVLVASTYPVEIVELNQWLNKNKGMAPAQMTQAVQNQGWDPSVQAMAAFPDVVKNMAENIGWTNQLGSAFLAQQGEVMDAVQRMRTKAMEAGKLQTSAQQTVQTETQNGQPVVVIQPANPDVVYVPEYNPAAVWGAPAYYPYPPMYYPPGYAVAASAISFGAGIAVGAIWGGGGWGWGPRWGYNNININNNNAFVRHYNNNPQLNGGRRYAGNGNNWRHNPARQNNIGRGQGSANRFGGGNGVAGPGGRGMGGRVGAPGNPAPGGAFAPGGGRGTPGIGTGNRAPFAGGSNTGSANRMGGGGMGNRQMSRPSGGGFGGGMRNGGGFNRGGGGMRGGGFHGGMRGGGRRR